MDAEKCIKTRRSKRKFLDKEVSEETVAELIDWARHAPSSHNDQPWEFVVIRKEKTKKKLSEIHNWSSFVKEAPVVIAVCYDTERGRFNPSTLIGAALGAENLLLAAHAKGLGACWVFVKDYDQPEVEKEVREILEVPEQVEVLCIIPVGYSEQRPGAKKLRDIEEITHFERY